MNSKTAEHLNRLFDNSRPITLDQNNVPRGDILRTCISETSPVAKELDRRIKPILDATESAVIAAEIRDAAKEKRQAKVTNPHFAPHWWKPETKSVPWPMTSRHWSHCRDQILAVIDAYNAERLAAYESYRIACEQGVAVPPQ